MEVLLEPVVDLRNLADRSCSTIDSCRRMAIGKNLEDNKLLFLSVIDLLSRESFTHYRPSVFDGLDREQRQLLQRGINTFREIIDFDTDEEHYFPCLVYFWNRLEGGNSVSSEETALRGNSVTPL